jgi:hypothetical protein
VWFDHDFFRSSCSETFPSSADFETVSGTWACECRHIDATAVTPSSIALPCRQTDLVKTDFVYRARLFNPYGGSGNLVGLVFNYQLPALCTPVTITNWFSRRLAARLPQQGHSGSQLQS